MKEELTIIDVFNTAIEMEDAGKIFYEFAVTMTEDENLKKAFKVLSEEEIRHKHIFENMKSKVSGIGISNDNNQYLKYLNEILNTKSVFDIKKFNDDKDKVNKLIDIINFAIERELDSIMYYMTLMAVVREEQRHIVQDIINEERKHFIKLNETKKLINKN